MIFVLPLFAGFLILLFVSQSCLSVEWYSPLNILEKARFVLEKIDLDPASCAIANESVQAERYYTQEDDGLSLPWGSHDEPLTVFLNPPGGKRKGESLQKLFWKNLIEEYTLGNVHSAVFLAFSIELLQVSQNKQPDPKFWCLSYPFCVPRKRLNFTDSEGNKRKGGSPKASAIIYLPPKGYGSEELLKFEQAFSEFGAVIFPPQTLKNF